MRGNTIEARLRALEDVNEIIKLKSRYLNAVDGGWDRPSHDADKIVALFVEDGSWETAATGKVTGHEALRSTFAQFQKELPFAYHIVTSPIIDVDGDEATGDWHLLWLVTHANGQALWAAAKYTDRYVRTKDGWRIKSMDIRAAFLGPYESGWVNALQKTP